MQSRIVRPDLNFFLFRQDKDLLKKCANFFVSNNQHEKAVHIYLSLDKKLAIDMCYEQNVYITEEI